MRFEELWVTWPSISKVLGVREQLAASHVNSQSLLNARRGLPEKTQGKWAQGMRQVPARRIFFGKRQGMWARSTASHINLQSPWMQDTLSLNKHMESGRVSATHVLVEKRHGIRERPVACHMNLQSQWTQDAFYLRKHKESGGVGTTCIFIEKHKESAGVGHPWHINSQSKWSLGAIYTVYTTISPGLVADWGRGVY